MVSIQYMTASGDWAISCQDGTPPPSPALILAPSSADGFHGMDGMRWDGKAWVDDPGASARAFAVMYPAQALEQERKSMVADKWQVVAALEVLHPGCWPLVADFRQSPKCTPVLGAAIDYAITLPRASESVETLAWIMDLDEFQVDEVFRLAMTIRG